MVTALELRLISERVPGRVGWDFSPMRVEEDQPPWRYEDVVRKYLTAGGRILDIGTGGGELFSTFEQEIGRGAGIDISRPRIEAAVANRRSGGHCNLEFLLMDAAWLAVKDSTFDAALAHHADFTCDEVLRVLRPGGVFVSQQMGERNTENIFQAFRWGSFGQFWRKQYRTRGGVFQTSADKASIFRSLGAEIIALSEYDVDQYLADLDSLVFFLKASPLPEAFEPEKHWRPVAELIDRYSTPRGIRTNAHRELLVARKP